MPDIDIKYDKATKIWTITPPMGFKAKKTAPDVKFSTDTDCELTFTDTNPYAQHVISVTKKPLSSGKKDDPAPMTQPPISKTSCTMKVTLPRTPSGRPRRGGILDDYTITVGDDAVRERKKK